MPDRLERFFNNPLISARSGYLVTPDDDADLPSFPASLYIGGAGDVVVDFPGYDGNPGETEVTFANVPAGAILPICVSRVREATTATTILAMGGYSVVAEEEGEGGGGGGSYTITTAAGESTVRGMMRSDDEPYGFDFGSATGDEPFGEDLIMELTSDQPGGSGLLALSILNDHTADGLVTGKALVIDGIEIAAFADIFASDYNASENNTNYIWFGSFAFDIGEDYVITIEDAE